MDSFKIIVIIFMIIIIIKVFMLDNDKENFSNAEQSIGGVDDTNAINTLAQLARKLMDGGATVPGNLNVQGVLTLKNDIWNNSADGKLRTYYANNSTTYMGTGDGYVWRRADDKQDMMTLDNTASLNVQGAIKFKNKWMIGGSGGGSGDDEWVRMTGLDNKTYYGGFAAGKLFTADNTINGRNIFAELDDLKANAVRKNKDFTIALRDQGNGAVGGGTTLGACGPACGGGANLTGTTDGNRTLILQIRQ
jgi:hypothetical protein